MKKISSYLRSHFSTLLVGLVFSLGCECCCDCKGEGVGTLTIAIEFLPTYTGRTCPIPVPAGALTGIGGNKVSTLCFECLPFHTGSQYYLWVEFESCCKDFQRSDEFQPMQSSQMVILNNGVTTLLLIPQLVAPLLHFLFQHLVQMVMG